VEGRRTADWDRGNERCQLVKETKRAWFEILAQSHPIPRIRPETAGDISRDALARHREGQGMTQRELATLLRIDRSTLAKWERKERLPTGQFVSG